MSLIGGHISSNPISLIKEASYIKSIGGNLIQIFVDPLYKNINDYDIFNNWLKNNNMFCVVHASYTINIASDWNEYSWSIKQFILEIQTAHRVGAFGIVLHLGKQLELSKEEAYNNMYTSLLYIHNQTKNNNIKIFIETSTGQGSEMCYILEDLAYFYKKLSTHKNPDIKNRFKICLDTCHIFSAGYNIKTNPNIIKYFKDFENKIGIKEIGLVHLNDAKYDVGSKLDRHEDLGKGFIGKKPLLKIIKFLKKFKIPIVLETSGNHYKEEFKEYLL